MRPDQRLYMTLSGPSVTGPSLPALEKNQQAEGNSWCIGLKKSYFENYLADRKATTCI